MAESTLILWPKQLWPNRPAPIFMVHSTYANILKNIYKKVRKIVDFIVYLMTKSNKIEKFIFCVISPLNICADILIFCLLFH
jgi:hypothetical protein